MALYRSGLPAPPPSPFIDVVTNCSKGTLSSGVRNSPRAMPLSVAPHRTIAFSFHKSLLFLVNFFQDDTLGVTRNWLCISILGDFRVVKIPTLKMVKCLLFSYLQVALYVAELQVCTATRSPCEDQALPLSWAPPSSAEGGKSSQGQPCCRLHILI